MKYQSKADLIADSEEHWLKLWKLIEQIPNTELTRRADLDEPPRSVVDHLAHLHGWHRLLLQWVKSGPNGIPELPAKGFKWNQTRALNQVLFDEFKDETYPGMRRKLKLSHGRVMKFVTELPGSKLMQPGHFDWTQKLPLASYIGPNTAGHYRWAEKKIRRIKQSLSP